MEQLNNLGDFIALHNSIMKAHKNDTKIWLYILIGIIIIMGIIILYLISKPIIVNNAYENLLNKIIENKNHNINTLDMKTPDTKSIDTKTQITPIIDNTERNIYDDFTNRYQNPSFY
ncbi:hypothetical protein mvtv_3 [Megavirus vitis transpoviron]|uniref:Uncharacterized protein n=1 Tax=Megavirus vitis transpoviron TaxID=2711275 RepID=A0A2P1EHG7_9VIRU|nr:hypothetical protein mvtv_3 [Megavirus vitis transpoviron]